MASPRGAGAFACGGSRTRLRVAGDCRTRGVSRVTHLPPERTRLRPPKVTNLASPGVAMRHAIRACATQKPAVLIGCRAAPSEGPGGRPHIGRVFLRVSLGRLRWRWIRGAFKREADGHG